MFGHIQPGGVLEIASLCVTGVGLISRLQPAVDTRLATEPEPVMVRDVYSENAGKMLPTPVYAGEQLAPAISLKGPVLIEESTSTIFVDQTDRVEVDPSGNYLIHIG
jgi:N-methylhydantoinase A